MTTWSGSFSYVCFLIGISCSIPTQAAEYAKNQEQIENYKQSNRYEIGEDGKSITFQTTHKTTSCKVNIPIERLKPSFDELSIIISKNHFISIKQLNGCDQSPIIAQSIPYASGMLTDINEKSGIYISLIFVSVQPLSFVAKVSKLKENQALISLPGSFKSRDSLKKQKRESFIYADIDRLSSKISIDARYVAVSGIIDCSASAYPGVWDLKLKKKIILNGSSEEVKVSCNRLFGL